MAKKFEIDEERLLELREQKEMYEKTVFGEGQEAGREWAKAQPYHHLASVRNDIPLDDDDEPDLTDLGDMLVYLSPQDFPLLHLAGHHPSWWEGFADGVLDVYNRI